MGNKVKRDITGVAGDIKRELAFVEGRLGAVVGEQWKYARRLVRFGFASWVFGISVFVAAILVSAPEVLPIMAASTWLIIAAVAAPLAVAGAFVFRLSRKIGELERMRVDLLVKYRAVALKQAERIIGQLSEPVLRADA